MSSSTSVVLMPAAAIASMYDCFLPSLDVCGSLGGFVCGFGAAWAVGADAGFAACAVRSFDEAGSGLTTITLLLSCSCFRVALAPSAACATPQNALPASQAPATQTQLPAHP